MDDGHQPDSAEKCIRFGCGFVFGAFVAFLSGLREVAAITGTFWAVVIGVALIVGFLAMRYGDDFWRYILRSFWW